MANGDVTATGPWLDDLQAQLEGMLLDGTRGLAAQLAEFARQRVEVALREDRARRVLAPAPVEAVEYGSVLAVKETLSVFAAPGRLTPVGRLAKGDLVAAAGPFQELEGGRVVLPIVNPAGAVDFGMLAHRPDLRASYTVKAQRLDVFRSPTSWEAVEGSELVQGDRVEAAGQPVDAQGSLMLPIVPQGAVELCHLEIAEFVERRLGLADAGPEPPPATRQAEGDECSKLSATAELSEVHSVPVSEDAVLHLDLQAELEDLRRDAEILRKQVDRTGGSAQARHLADAAEERYREALARVRSQRSAAQLYRAVPRAQQADRTPPFGAAPIMEPLPERAGDILATSMSPQALQLRRALLSKNEELGRRLEGISDGLQRSMRSGP